MAFALPLAASAMAAAAPAAAAAATKVTLMAVAKSVLMNVAISAAMSALQPQVGSAGRTFEWTLDPNAPIPFAAGRVGVAGTVAHLETYGPDKMYYGFVSILSGAGPIRGITGFKGDDEVVTFDGNGKAVSSQWAGEMWMRSRLGTQPDTALTNPPGLKSNAQLPGWTAAHKLSGKACYMLVLGENSKRTAYPTGEPKPLVTVEGLYGWDPRQDSTYPGGAGPCRLNNPATWVWLDNPILWGLKWALGLWEGPTGKGAPGVDYQVGGIGAKVEGIRVDRFVAAANVADANGWKVAAYPTTDDDKSQVLDSFLQAGGAIYAQEQGKISCIQRAAPRASIVTITAADTAGPLEIDTAASRIDRINTIRPRFWSEAHRWQMTAIDDVTADAYRIEDGAVRPRGIDYPYVPFATQTAQLAGLQIANTREPIAGTIPLKPHLRNIAPGTAFTISEPGFLLDGLKCLCLNSDYDPATGVVSVTFVSETDAKYPFALGQSPNPPAPPVLTAPDLVVTPPQAGEWTLTAANFVNDGVSVPALLFAGSVENSRAISVIFEFRPFGAADWSGAGIEDPTIERKEAAGGLLTPGVQYQGAVSYRVGGNISERLILGPVTAGPLTAGEVAPITPGNVAGVPSLAITTTIAPDGTQTSRMFGDFADAADAVSYVAEIDDGTLVQQVPLAESAIEDRVVATGPTYRYRVRGVSRTGTPSAAWSAWSNVSTAGGDNTGPGPITAPYIQGGIGQIAMRWTNPADPDFARVLIFRNTSGTGPETTGEAPYAWASGSNFVDDGAVIGTQYYYWALPQDRTGNGSWNSLVYIGEANARRTRFDTDLVLIPPRLDPHPIFGGDYMRTDRLVYDDGNTMQSLRPAEFGSNVTESRTAAAFQGQGLLATKNQAVWGADVAGRPAELTDGRIGAGLTPVGRAVAVDVPDVRNDNESPAQYRARGRGVWQEFKIRGAIGAPGSMSIYVQLETVVPYPDQSGGVIVQTVRGDDGIYKRRSFVNNDSGGWGAWEKSYDQQNRPIFNFDLLESNGSTVATDANFKTILGPAASFVGQGLLATKNQANFGTDVTAIPARLAAHPTYGANYIDTNAVVYAAGGGLEYYRPLEPLANVTETRTASAITGQGYFATQNFADWSSRITGAGKPSDNAGTSGVLKAFGSYTTVRGNTVQKFSGAHGAVEGGAVGLPQKGTAFISSSLIAAENGGGWKTVLGLDPTGPTNLNTGLTYSVSYDANAGSGYINTYIPGVYTGSFPVPAVTAASRMTLAYDGASMSYIIDGTVYYKHAAPAGLVLWPKVFDFYNTGNSNYQIEDVQQGAWSEAARIDGIRKSVGTGQYGQAELVTVEGPSASVIGQTAWATLVRSIVAISKLDDGGRIIDGQALPLNGMSKSSTLAPAYPFSAGSDPATQINIAATVATFAGGSTLSMPSATISGLTASTLYAIFRDLVANTFVAVSGSTTPYFTSAQRYLYIGTQATQEVGGGYEPLPPPPPGSGGGYGDIPAYIPA